MTHRTTARITNQASARTLTHEEIIEKFAAAMHGHGLYFDEPIIADGRIHRYRVKDDRKGRRNGWAIIYPGKYPAGAFGCWKRGIKCKWVAKELQQYATAERAELRRERQQQIADKATKDQVNASAAALVANEIWQKSVPCIDHPYLRLKRVKHFGVLKVGQWTVTNPDTGEITVVSDNAILVPMRSSAGKIESLQAIFPNSTNVLRRDKSYLAHARKKGCYCAIGTINGHDHILTICEGLATGLAIHECTGYAVAVAFDSCNLIHVAKTMRARLPDIRIVLAGDNDRWTMEPIDNPGLHYATAAAKQVGGVVAVPEFSNLDSRPTDFNDLHVLEGEQVVRDIFERALNPPATEAPAPHSEKAPESDGTESAESEETPGAHVEMPNDNGSGPSGPDEGPANKYFAILGHDRGQFFFFQHEARQILAYSNSDMTEAGLIALAPLNWWESHFPSSGKSGIDRKSCLEFLMRTAYARGIFDPERVRGRGAWPDGNRIVFHHGEHLVVDGQRMELTNISSKYFYEARANLFESVAEGLTDDEGCQILAAIKTWNWKNKGDAALIAGWITLAPICGVLRWRPHVWLTGGKGTGKTTLVQKIVHPLLRGAGIFVISNTTEPGIRQELHSDARPVIFDEAEGGDDRADNRISEVISLMRQASSDTTAHIAKGTQHGKALRFSCRSSFLLASIRAPVIQPADVSRISVLSLKPFETSATQDEKTLGMIDTLMRNEHVGARLLKRLLDNFRAVEGNIATFIRVAARIMATRRDADQLGTLVAGVWTLTSSRIATDEEAAEYLREFDWGASREEAASSEGETVLQTMARQRVRDENNREIVVAELIAAAVGKGLLDRGAEEADHLLQGHGLRVMELDGRWKLLVAKSHGAVRALAKGSSFESDPWQQLERIEGARTPKQGEKREKQRFAFARNPCRYIEIPIECVLGEDWESALDTSDPSHVEGEELFANRHPRASKLQ